MSTETTTKPFTNAELTAIVIALQAKIAELEAKLEPKKHDTKEMTDEMARRVLFGDLKDTKHKDAAEKLGLTYGQVYSCRLEFTFKNIHKEMKDKKIANQWKK